MQDVLDKAKRRYERVAGSEEKDSATETESTEALLRAKTLVLGYARHV